MKQYLIQKNLTTRERIEQAATKLGIPAIGSRESLLLKIKQKPYSQILKCIKEM